MHCLYFCPQSTLPPTPGAFGQDGFCPCKNTDGQPDSASAKTHSSHSSRSAKAFLALYHHKVQAELVDEATASQAWKLHPILALIQQVATNCNELQAELVDEATASQASELHRNAADGRLGVDAPRETDQFYRLSIEECFYVGGMGTNSQAEVISAEEFRCANFAEVVGGGGRECEGGLSHCRAGGQQVLVIVGRMPLGVWGGIKPKEFPPPFPVATNN